MALRQLGTEMPRQDRILLKRLARWFSGRPGLEAAIKRPDVLAICLALIQGNDGGHKPSPAEIGSAVRVGFCSIGRTLSTRGRLLRLFFYPAMLLAAMALLTVVFSTTIIPSFEQTFDDFGIELSRLTTLLFKLAWVVRYCWVFVFSCLAGFAVLAFLMNALTSGRRVVGTSWLDQRCKTSRNAVAGWAWHLAMLLDAGFVSTRAVEIAGNSQHKYWLKRVCRKWVTNQSEAKVSVGIAPLSGFEHRYPLIHTTLGVDNHDAQVDLLKEIAAYYWDRNRAIGDWWMQWAVSILIWVLVGAIVLAVFALYSPMLWIVTGLMPGGYPWYGF